MPRKRAQTDDEADLEPEDVLDDIFEKGSVVFTHDWDSGGLGAGAGSEAVYRWRGRYVVTQDTGCSGPYDTLEKALRKNGLLVVTSATTEVGCSVLSAKRLAGMLSCQEDGHVIDINGHPWVYHRRGGFKRVKTTD